jgi:hypothetical protein
METQLHQRTAVLAMAALSALLACSFSDAQAGIEVQGKIFKKGSNVPTEGKITAQPGFQKYVITTRMPGGAEVSTEIEASRVERVEVPQPEDLRKAIRMLQTQPAAAIPILKKVVSDYVWLSWDMVAARYLLDAYLKSGQPAEAIKTANSILAGNKDALLNPDFLTAYADAMVADNKEAGLGTILSDAIQKGDREVVAVAYVKRGNVLKKKGNLKEALWDNYLRVTEMFREQKDVQPEALYHAARCFDELGMGSHAERMRKRLLVEYEGSTWAERLKSGA